MLKNPPWANSHCRSRGSGMIVERLKYVIWAADMDRAVEFYSRVFSGNVLKQNQIISEVAVANGVIGIHGGGEGTRTWTGLSFQVPDVIAGAAEIVAAGGQLLRRERAVPDPAPHSTPSIQPSTLPSVRNAPFRSGLNAFAREPSPSDVRSHIASE